MMQDPNSMYILNSLHWCIQGIEIVWIMSVRELFGGDEKDQMPSTPLTRSKSTFSRGGRPIFHWLKLKFLKCFVAHVLHTHKSREEPTFCSFMRTRLKRSWSSRIFVEHSQADCLENNKLANPNTLLVRKASLYVDKCGECGQVNVPNA